MKPTPLFEIQKDLDTRILVKHELSISLDLLYKRFLASLVELGECANDDRSFKYWSENQQPKSTVLEEYVDKLHFVLSVGLALQSLGFITKLPVLLNPAGQMDKTKQFLDVYAATTRLYESVKQEAATIAIWYKRLFELFLGLGVALGFTEDQIESAYMKKNEVNHQRQREGY